MTKLSTARLYLSRLILNPLSRQVRSEIANPYEMHRTLMQAFPKATNDTKKNARDEFGVLFRADVDDKWGVAKIYVQSTIQPNWSFLNELNGYLGTDAGILKCEYKDIMPAFRNMQNGQVFRFRLRANPTKRIAKVTKSDPDLKGKRIGLWNEELQIDWLIRKGKEREKGRPGGFEVLHKDVEDRQGEVKQIPRMDVCREGKQRGRKKTTKRGHVTTHLAVRFDGLLRITDANAFRETLVRGIGPAKAFGFGLLSVAPG